MGVCLGDCYIHFYYKSYFEGYHLLYFSWLTVCFRIVATKFPSAGDVASCCVRLSVTNIFDVELWCSMRSGLFPWDCCVLLLLLSRVLPWQSVVVCSGDCYPTTARVTLRDAVLLLQELF